MLDCYDLPDVVHTDRAPCVWLLESDRPRLARGGKSLLSRPLPDPTPSQAAALAGLLLPPPHPGMTRLLTTLRVSPDGLAVEFSATDGPCAAG